MYRSRTGARYSATASPTADLKSPYPDPSNSASISSGEAPRTTQRISIRFSIPSLPDSFGPARLTSRPESVTALRNFLRIRSGSSST